MMRMPSGSPARRSMRSPVLRGIKGMYPRSATLASADRSILGELLGDINWSPGYVALLYYLVSVITFRIPGADIAAVVCLSAVLVRPEYIRVSVPITWFAAFVAWAGLGVPSSYYRALALENWISLAKVLLVAVMVYSTIRTRNQLRMCMLVCVVSFLLFPFRGALVNYVFGYALFGRALWNYVYANPNDLAALAILFSSIAAAAAAMYRHRLFKVGLLACSLSFAFLVFMTQSRGAVVGMALAALLAFGWSKYKLRIAAGVGVLLLVTAMIAPSSVWHRLSGLSRVSLDSGMRGVDEEGSAEQRFQIAQVALAVALNQPLLGVGVGAYPAAHARQAAIMRSELPIAGGERDAHNTYLRVIAELGVPGLSCFLGILAATAAIVFRVLRRRSASPAYVGAARSLGLGLLAYCIAGVFGSFAYINLLYVHIAMISLLALHNDAPARSPRSIDR
jgi:O-antigen ligase